MNAAFVLLTSVMLGHGGPATSCNAPACSAPAPACSTCAPCASPGFGHRLRGQLSGLFSCHSCKSECAPACAAPAPAPAPCPAPAPACCEAPACSSCGHGHGGGFGGFLGKLRGRFSHSSSCCDTCAAPACNTCGGAAAPGAPAGPATPAAPAGENIKEAPKKMPEAPKGAAPKGDKAVRFDQTPEAPLAIPSENPVIDTARPAAIAAPATLRNPF